MKKQKLLPKVDETGTNGIWDLAGEIVVTAVLQYKQNSNGEPIYAEDCGQEIVYNLIKNYIKERI